MVHTPPRPLPSAVQQAVPKASTSFWSALHECAWHDRRVPAKSWDAVGPGPPSCLFACYLYAALCSLLWPELCGSSMVWTMRLPMLASMIYLWATWTIRGKSFPVTNSLSVRIQLPLRPYLAVALPPRPVTACLFSCNTSCRIRYAMAGFTCLCALLYLAPLCTPGVVGGVVILPSMSQLVYHQHHHRHHEKCTMIAHQHMKIADAAAVAAARQQPR
jgi:hypothetical protein